MPQQEAEFGGWWASRTEVLDRRLVAELLEHTHRLGEPITRLANGDVDDELVTHDFPHDIVWIPLQKAKGKNGQAAVLAVDRIAVSVRRILSRAGHCRHPGARSRPDEYDPRRTQRRRRATRDPGQSARPLAASRQLALVVRASTVRPGYHAALCYPCGRHRVPPLSPRNDVAPPRPR